MRVTLRFLLLLIAIWIGAACAAFAQPALDEGVRISKIVITNIGPQAVNEDLIRAHIRVKVGERYSEPALAAALDDDIANLAATGYFYNIHVNKDEGPDGRVLTYIVWGKLKITDINFSGNQQLKESKLKKKVTVKINEPLNQQKLFSDVQELKKLYQKNGYPNTEIKYVVTPDENAGQAAVTFEIKESPKIRIIDVQFVGATAFPQSKLRKVIKTRRHWMFSWITGSGVLKEDVLEDDKDKLADFYREHGYIDFELKEVKPDYPEKGRMVLRFYVYEGKPYKVGAITIQGNTVFSTNEIFAGLHSTPKPQGSKKKPGVHGFVMDVGDDFTPGGLTDDIQQIQDFYGARGYIDVSENPNSLRVEKIPNTENNTMDLLFEINEGQKTTIEKVEIRGNTKTKDKVIRRELAVSPGETFNMVLVKLSKSHLDQMQFFERVETKSEPIGATDVPGLKNLVINVQEKNTGNLTLGAGFSSIDNLVGFVDVSQGNFDIFNPPTFTGAGQKARLHLALGTQRRDIELSFVEPWFLGQRLEFGVDFFHSELDYVSLNSLYNEIRTGGRLSLTKDLWRNKLIGSVNYTIEDVGIVDVVPGAPSDIFMEEGHHLLSRFGASLAYDTRNNVLLPDKGQRTEIFGQMIGGPFGGDRNFYEAQLKTGWYFKGLASGHVLEVVGVAGIAKSFSGTTDVPFYDRYYLGGADTLRGYRYRDIGPKKYDGSFNLEPVGGDTYWFGSAEYSIPLIERLRLAVFYDIGMVYPNAFSFSPDPSRGIGYDTGLYSDNWGIGIRLNLPIGPLRLDYGIPMTHDRNTSGNGRVQFTVGYTRSY